MGVFPGVFPKTNEIHKQSYGLDGSGVERIRTIPYSSRSFHVFDANEQVKSNLLEGGYLTSLLACWSPVR